MALTAPTPPVPPKPPVMPGTGQDRDAGESAAGQADGNANAAGHDFGVHITINPPSVPGQGASSHSGSREQRAADQGAQQGATDGQNSQQTVQKQPARQDSAREANPGPDVAQQARQAAVQQLLGEDREEQSLESGIRTDTPWPIGENHVSFMSVLPFIIVFVAAFITFILRSMGKKQGILLKAAPQKGAQAAGGQTGAVPVQIGEAFPDSDGKGTVNKDTVKNEDKSKGRNFEMRI